MKKCIKMLNKKYKIAHKCNYVKYIQEYTAAKSLQLCPTLCDPRDSSLPGSPVPGTLQARILKWVAVPSPGELPDPRIEPGSPAL